MSTVQLSPAMACGSTPPVASHVAARPTLRLYVVNDSGRRDALTGVTSPLVQDDELRLDGPLVRQIPLPRGEAVNFEWSDASGIRLTGFRRPLSPASWMSISLHFLHSETVTMQVIAGPLGTPGST